LKFNRLLEEKHLGAFQDMRNVFRSLKRRRATRSIAHFVGPKLAGGSDFWLFPGKHVCLDCGYKGPIVMEMVEESEKGQ
jgi:hypothetical protein